MASTKPPRSSVAEDNMDLTPFIAQYVMQNPFDQLSSLVEDVNSEASVEKTDSKSNGSCEKNYSDQQIENSSNEDRSNEKLVEPECNTMRDGCSTSKNTAKAHIGSNASFAISLKNCLVASNRCDLQNWLWENYMYCPTHSGQVEVPAKDLLRHARQNFTHVSRSVFSRVVTFSFPESSKSNDGQYGANYRGLLAKPSATDYANKKVLRHVESYLGGDKNWLYGTLNYPENRALAILCWEGHIAKFPTNVMEQQNTLAAQLAEVEDVKPVINPDGSCEEGDNSSSENENPKSRVSSQTRHKKIDFKRLMDHVDSALSDLSSVDEEAGDPDYRVSSRNKNVPKTDKNKGYSMRPRLKRGSDQTDKGKNTNRKMCRQDPNGTSRSVLKSLLQSSSRCNNAQSVVTPVHNDVNGVGKDGLVIKEEPVDCYKNSEIFVEPMSQLLAETDSMASKSKPSVKTNSQAVYQETANSHRKDIEKCEPPHELLAVHSIHPNETFVNTLQLQLGAATVRVAHLERCNEKLEEDLAETRNKLISANNMLNFSTCNFRNLADKFLALNQQFGLLSKDFQEMVTNMTNTVTAVSLEDIR